VCWVFRVFGRRPFRAAMNQPLQIQQPQMATYQAIWSSIRDHSLRPSVAVTRTRSELQ
jgi:hypothetical protein